MSHISRDRPSIGADVIRSVLDSQVESRSQLIANGGSEAQPRATAVVPLDQKAIYGLYCMYAIVGLVYGFVNNYIQIPICQYVFGPMTMPGRSTQQQCIIAASFPVLPWNLKVFYGFILDRVMFCGTRRKGWIIFGWTGALIVLAALSFFAEDMAKEGNFFLYMMGLLVVCMFYIFSDVAGDGMTIELSKFEPEERRGWILTTGQLVRFSTTIFVNCIGIFAMNGPAYNGNFSFELPFEWVHLLLVVICIPLWIGMIVLLKDPPKENAEEHHSAKHVFTTMWGLMKTRAMLFLVVFQLANMGIANLMNPATQIIAQLAQPTPMQVSIGNLFGNVLFMVGVWMFRKWFLNINWRITFVWTTMLVSLNCIFQYILIRLKNGWFYAFSNNILSIIQGIAQVLSSLAVVEISPTGFEASVYEFLITMGNAGITLNTNLQNALLPVFGLSGFNIKDYSPEMYNHRLELSTWCTMGLNIVGALLFCMLLPTGKAQCKTWLDDPRFKNAFVGTLGLVIGWGAFLFSLIVSFLSAIPSTMCLKIAGGDGC